MNVRSDREIARMARRTVARRIQSNHGSDIATKLIEAERLFRQQEVDGDAPGQAGAQAKARIAKALREERRRGRQGHWGYDLNRHLALAQAFCALKQTNPRDDTGHGQPQSVNRSSSDFADAAGQGPSPWQGESVHERNSAKPSDNRAASSTSRDTLPATC